MQYGQYYNEVPFNFVEYGKWESANENPAYPSMHQWPHLGCPGKRRKP